jgi:hypothetical protein
MLSVGKLQAVKKNCQTKIGFLTQTFKLKAEIDMHKNIDLFVVTIIYKNFNKKLINYKK